jgi:hypothetical protein
VHADVGDPEGVRVVVAALHLPLRRALLVVLVRAPEVGPAASKFPSSSATCRHQFINHRSEYSSFDLFSIYTKY